jgi:putative NIF3 family GTP cyclohydrolase 1 type 2
MISMIQVSDIMRALEDFAPLAYQESYDNSGLQVGNPYDEIKGVLLTLDIAGMQYGYSPSSIDI